MQYTVGLDFLVLILLIEYLPIYDVCFCFYWAAFKLDIYDFSPPLPRLCLSITDFHPDTWNPAWSVSTILTGLLSFMVEKGPTLGSIETSDYAVSEERSHHGCNDVKISGLKAKWMIEKDGASWYELKLWNLNLKFCTHHMQNCNIRRQFLGMAFRICDNHVRKHGCRSAFSQIWLNKPATSRAFQVHLPFPKRQKNMYYNSFLQKNVYTFAQHR